MQSSFSIGAVGRGQVKYSVGNQGAVLSVGALAVSNPESLHFPAILSLEVVRETTRLLITLKYCGAFYKALFTVMLSDTTGFTIRCFYALWMIVVVFFRDSGVVMVIGWGRVRLWLGRSVFLVDLVSGGILTFFGLLFAFT